MEQYAANPPHSLFSKEERYLNWHPKYDDGHEWLLHFAIARLDVIEAWQFSLNILISI
jgi:hypothetical protein